MRKIENRKIARIKTLEEKVEVLGQTVTNLYKELIQFRAVVGILEQSGLLKEAVEKIDGPKMDGLDTEE